MAQNPLEQFTINTIVPIEFAGINASITNTAVAMAVTVAAVSIFLIMGIGKGKLVPTRWQSMAELTYSFIADMVRDNVGNEGRKYFPIVFSLFMFILFGNLLGMIPYSFTFTSHMAVTFTLAIAVFVGVTLIGIARHGLHFLTFFVPSGVPTVLMPLLVPIEIISYLSRPVSLGIRLFANMTAGHTMLKVFASFIIPLGIIGGWAPFAVNIALTCFEFLIAFLQAYVFAVLTCIYLNDSIHLH